MLPSSDTPTNERSRQLRRWGPIALLVVVALVVGAVVVLSGGDDEEEPDEVSSGDNGAAAGELPEGAVSWEMAQEDDLDVTFPDTCDTELGRVAIPVSNAQPCFADVEDNGGATSKGVTEDTIKVVLYMAQEDDGILNFITAAVNADDTNAQAEATYQAYTDMFNEYYQTYGRTVELELLTASGLGNDEVAARADAVRAADEMGAFAVWGGPILTTAFADELTARGVVCIDCTIGAPPEFYEERAPYAFAGGMNADQVQIHLAEWMSKKVAGRPAEFAGDPALAEQDRKFGLMWIEANETSGEVNDRLIERLGDVDIELAENLPFVLDPARLQEQATSLISQLKASEVTSVIFSGDPVALATFTREATAQDYRPEWILGPQTLVDTTAFSRTYDQDQWSHAFGISPLTARFDPEFAPAYVLHEWFTGEPAPADDAAQLLLAPPALFFAGLQSAGPNLTPENFAAGLQSAPPDDESLITQADVSFGDHGLWPYTDWNGTDNMVEIWWDAEATGVDEITNEGTGMWAYVDGGKRYLPGEWEEEELRMFDPEGAVTIFDGPLPEESPPDYPSPAGG